MTLAKAPTTADRSAWAWMRRLARAATPELWGLYEYVVTSAVLNGGIEATATDTSLPIPSQVHIPIRPGIPGADVVPAGGSLCYVAFANGDRSKPIVHSFDSTEAQSVAIAATSLTLGASPTQSEALGDVVSTQLASVKGIVDAMVADLVVVFTATSSGTPTSSGLLVAFKTAMGVTNKSATVKTSP